MRIKIIFTFLFILTLISCNGTLGGFNTRIFPVSKQKLVIAIDSLYKENPEMHIPEKWKKNDSWKKRGYGFLDTRIFYLKNNPEEMYYISFIGDENDSIESDNNSTSIAIRAVFTNQFKKWLYEEEFDEKEKNRIENRFDKEIISKLEKIYWRKNQNRKLTLLTANTTDLGNGRNAKLVLYLGDLSNLNKWLNLI